MLFLIVLFWSMGSKFFTIMHNSNTYQRYNFDTYPNISVNADLFYANFTNTVFQNKPGFFILHQFLHLRAQVIGILLPLLPYSMLVNVISHDPNFAQSKLCMIQILLNPNFAQ